MTFVRPLGPTEQVWGKHGGRDFWEARTCVGISSSVWGLWWHCWWGMDLACLKNVLLISYADSNTTTCQSRKKFILSRVILTWVRILPMQCHRLAICSEPGEITSDPQVTDCMEAGNNRSICLAQTLGFNETMRKNTWRCGTAVRIRNTGQVPCQGNHEDLQHCLESRAVSFYFADSWRGEAHH